MYRAIVSCPHVFPAYIRDVRLYGLVVGWHSSVLETVCPPFHGGWVGRIMSSASGSIKWHEAPYPTVTTAVWPLKWNYSSSWLIHREDSDCSWHWNKEELHVLSGRHVLACPVERGNMMFCNSGTFQFLEILGTYPLSWGSYLNHQLCSVIT
jgi:hypothetical protein